MGPCSPAPPGTPFRTGPFVYSRTRAGLSRTRVRDPLGTPPVAPLRLRHNPAAPTSLLTEPLVCARPAQTATRERLR